MIKNTTPTVDGISTIDFTGNVIPTAWYKNNLLKYNNGKLNLNAVIILSEIVYWYRPTIDEDEHSGEIVAIRKKFDADKLQKSYKALANKFGISKRQAQEACYFLRDKNLITIETRNILSKTDKFPINNVTYIEPVVENIKIVSDVTKWDTFQVGYCYTSQRNTATHSNVIPSTSERDTLIRQNVSYPTPECETYTKTTAENSTNITTDNFIFPDAAIADTGTKIQKSNNDFLYKMDNSPQDSINIKVNHNSFLEEIPPSPNSMSSPSPSNYETDNQSRNREIVNKLIPVYEIQNNKLIISKNLTPEMAQKESRNPQLINALKQSRLKFNIRPDNPHLKLFGKYQEFLFNVLAYRLLVGNITYQNIETTFRLMEQDNDVSIMRFLSELKNDKYKDHEVLLDFHSIMSFGIVSDFGVQAASSARLRKSIEKGMLTLLQVEEIYFWTRDKSCGKFCGLQYVAKNAVAYLESKNNNLKNNSGYKSRNDKDFEILKGRDYDKLAAEGAIETEKDRILRKMGLA